MGAAENELALGAAPEVGVLADGEVAEVASGVPEVGVLADARRVVVALGGNAIQRGDDYFSNEAVREAARAVVEVFGDRALAITHGNGPQFGVIECEGDTVGETIARTQGMIGNMIRNALLEFTSRSAHLHMTQVVVDPRGEDFTKPVKGVGKPSTDEGVFSKKGAVYSAFSRMPGHFREIVPSPIPREIIGIDSIQRDVETGSIVICGGGGGVPVVRRPEGQLRLAGSSDFLPVSRRVVVDKDMTSALIAEGIAADVLVILTGVEGFLKNFKAGRGELVRSMSVDEALASINDSNMGNMGPKLQAAAQFAASGEGRKAVITSIEALGTFQGKDYRGTLIKA